MEIKAIQKYEVTSPQKLRKVATMIKKLKPQEAYEKLPFVGKRAAEPLRKVMGTAIANAKQQGISENDLAIKEIQINQGPRLKRWRAGARGRVKPYKKRMSHIRVVLTTTEKSKAQSTKSESKTKVQKTESQTKKKAADKKAGKSKKNGKNKKKETKSDKGKSASKKGKMKKEKKSKSKKGGKS